MSKHLKHNLLEEFLNLYWIRPEVALFLAISSHVLNEAPYHPASEKPSLDMGAGNGLFSFLSLGGAISHDYDMYLHASKLDQFSNNVDIYDHFSGSGDKKWILERPAMTYTYGFDHKENLKKQSEFLDLYEDYKIGNANEKWPFQDSELASIFSNIFYWLQDPEFLFKELNRVLTSGGRAFLGLQDPSLPSLCPSYHGQDYPGYEDLMKILNRGRADSYLWRRSLSELESLAKKNNLKVVHARHYLSETVLKIWDIGLRPVSPVLISMANSLSAEERLKHKELWLETVSKLLLPVFEKEKDVTDHGGYLYVIVEKN